MSLDRLSSLIGLACLASAAACGGQDIQGPATTGPMMQTNRFTTAAKVYGFLNGKTMVMEGTSIPTHPNGYDENVNYGQATQCYKKVTMTWPADGRLHLDTQVGTLMNAPMVNQRGQCDHTTMAASLNFDSSAVLIENVKNNAACFDFTVTFNGFQQEGRGSISPDAKKVTLELFFKDQATGNRCADGDVGAPTIIMKMMPFTGNAKQVYTIAE